MKLTLTLILFAALAATAGSTYSQSARINLKMQNATLVDVFREIERTSEFGFFFKSEEIDLNKRVSVDLQNVSIEEVLKKILMDNYEYRILDKNIVVTRGSFNTTEVQQGKSVSGKVTDSSGSPIPGVSIVVKGTTIGTITDSNGNYSLSNIPENAIVQFSFVGMKSQEISVAGKTIINVEFAEETVGIEEVIAIGYGTKTKETLTGSISIIDKKDLEGKITSKTSDLLQGMGGGIQVVRANTGNLRGSQNQITIRGVTSRNTPGVLVVVDGIAQSSTDASALDNINPEDIASISVLKDGQAAIYGSRAAGGVILVTTKSGESVKPVIKFSMDYTMQTPSTLHRHPANIIQMAEIHNEGFVNDGQSSNLFSGVTKYIKDNNLTFDDLKANSGEYVTASPYDGIPYAIGHYDWYDIMFDPAPMQQYNVSISGKTERMNYYESINYTNQDGMLAYGKNYKKRLLVTLKNDYALTNFLKITSNFKIGTQNVIEPYNYSSIDANNNATYNTGVQSSLWFILPNNMPFTPGGHYYNLGGFHDPIGYAEAGGNTTDLSYIINSNVGVEITPIKNVVISGNYSSNFNLKETDWASIGFPMYDMNDKFNQLSSDGGTPNQAGASYFRDRYTSASSNIRYNYIGKGYHKFSLMAGYSHEENDQRGFSAYRMYGLINKDLPTMGMGDSKNQYNSEYKTDYALRSAFSRVEYSFKNRYLLEGIMRYDGSSKFASGYKWKPFGSISGGWVISDESFMKNTKKVIDFLKLRGSWGVMGNQASIGLYDYLSQISVYGAYPMGSYSSPGQIQSAFLGSMASTSRTWENIITKNMGIDLTALDSRLTASVDVFIKDNRDMFYRMEFPKVLGTNPPTVNGAHVRTEGWELELGWRNNENALKYFVKLNLSDNITNVIKLPDAAYPSLGLNTFVEGNPLNSYYGFKYDGLIQNDSELQTYKSRFTSGIPNNLQLGDAKFRDMDGDGKLETLPYAVDKDGVSTPTSGDLVRIGDSGQHYIFGLTVGFSWKNFDFSSFFQGVLKQKIISPDKPITYWWEPMDEYYYHKTWSPERVDAIYPKLHQDGSLINYNYQYSDAPYKLVDNRYIRLKNIQIGYKLPKQICNIVKMDNIRILLVGTDIFEFSSLPLKQDPETPFYTRVTPFPRSYSVGVDLTF